MIQLLYIWGIAWDDTPFLNKISLSENKVLLVKPYLKIKTGIKEKLNFNIKRTEM